jgi:hypothetical protein
MTKVAAAAVAETDDSSRQKFDLDERTARFGEGRVREAGSKNHSDFAS